MRLRELLREAHRNTATGMSRALVWLVCWTVVVAAPVLLDLAGVSSILAAQQAYRHAGGDITVLSNPGHITASGCNGLSSVDGIDGAVAMRKTNMTVPLAVLPRTAPPLIEYAGDLSQVLPVKTAGPGVILDRSIAKELGAEAGTMLPTTSGAAEIRLAAVFDWDDDGRAATLSGAALAPVAATGAFNECWVRVWPPDKSLEPVMLLATDGDPSAQTTTAPLNPTLGAGHPTSELLAKRTTALTPWTAPMLAFVVGFLATRMRRIELATNIHAGARRTELALQAQLEVAAWAIPAAAVTAAAVWFLAQFLVAPVDAVSVFVGALPPIAAGVATALLGGLAAVATVRRNDLYRYIKDR